jgi:hypothetical protein
MRFHPIESTMKKHDLIRAFLGGYDGSGVRALALLSACLAGCGGSAPVYPVKGKVVLSDGRPLAGGAIQFIPKPGGMLAYGQIKPDGTFSLRSLDHREGAQAGEYKVRIEPSLEMTAPKGKKRPVLPFAERYVAEDGETGLTAVVKAEPTDLEPFRLDAR